MDDHLAERADELLQRATALRQRCQRLNERLKVVVVARENVGSTDLGMMSDEGFAGPQMERDAGCLGDDHRALVGGCRIHRRKLERDLRCCRGSDC